MKYAITHRALLLISALLAAAGVSLLLFATPSIVVGSVNQQTEPFEDVDCLNCHTDRQRLTDLIPPKPEEVTESLSSGPG